jgi:hypothetical protein
MVAEACNHPNLLLPFVLAVGVMLIMVASVADRNAHLKIKEEFQQGIFPWIAYDDLRDVGLQ